MPGITLNPSPTGDDWAQITAAVTTLRANKLGWIEFEQLNSLVPFNIKKSVDLTSLWAADIRFAPGTIVRCDGFTGDGNGRSAPMFDFSNSSLSRIIGEGNSACFLQGFDANSPVGTVKPNCAILIANGDSKRIENMCTNGQFTSAAVALVACTSIQIFGGGFGNLDATAPVLTLSSNPDWGLWSPYSKFNAMGFVADIEVNSEIHGLGKQAWTVYVRDAHNVLFRHCLLDNNNRAHVLFQGNSDGIVFDSGKGYSELGVSLAGVVECGAPDAVRNLKMIGFTPNNGIPLTIGSGNYTGLQEI
jgi:hypothetical protein